MTTRLLVIDDDTTYRERLVRAFSARGHEARAAEDGAAGLEAARAFVPERVVLDLKMPGANGLSVLRALLAELPDLQIIILTGYGSIATALEAVRLGAVDYLTKPADADQILAAFEKPGGAIGHADDTPEVPTLDRVEWEHIQRVLTECGGNISEGARRLGLHRRTLQRKLDKFPPGR
ncbi:MAG: response regulator [Chthoniobacter sp.]|nr:response regulator [Chthoniobacter sp.]